METDFISRSGTRNRTFGSAQFRRRLLEGRSYGVIELTNALKARRESDLVNRESSIPKQMTSGPQSAGIGDLNRCRTQMLREQTAQMPRADTETVCQFIHAAAVERAFANQF